jgi:hypothetical protein
MTAGFRGSSSGIPTSTFPIKSAPTSAAFVKIPPPSYANIATKDAPKPNPRSSTGIYSIGGRDPGTGEFKKKWKLSAK